MTSPPPPPPWLALHLRYPSTEARLRLIVEHLPRLSGAAGSRRWFWTDIPFETAAGGAHGLEVVIERLPDDGALQADLTACLGGAAAAGMLAAVTRAPAALVLQPWLFPGEVVPACYPLLHARARARAQARLAGNDSGDEAAQAEIALLVASLVPPRQRAPVYRWHADWLESVAEAQGAADADPVVALPAPPAATDGDVGYLAHYASLARHAAQVTARARAVGDSDTTLGAARAALVARLAHTQAIRLWGPERPDALRREAALVRALAG